MKPLTIIEFERNLRELARKNDLDIEQVLTYAGMSNFYHYRWKNGNRKVKGRLPNYLELHRMAEKLNCSLDDIVYGDKKSKKILISLDCYDRMKKNAEKLSKIKELIISKCETDSKRK